MFQLFALVLRNADKSTVRPLIPCSARHFWKGVKFAGSVGHPMTKMLSAYQGGFAPLTRCSAPGSRWGLCPQAAVIGSCSALAMVPPNHSPLPPPMDMTPVDTITQWREDWPSASVLNHTIVTDPTPRQPGFHLRRHTRSLMNRFRTGQGPCLANLHKWGLTQSPSCDCGQRHTMNHFQMPSAVCGGY